MFIHLFKYGLRSIEDKPTSSFIENSWNTAMMIIILRANCLHNYKESRTPATDTSSCKKELHNLMFIR